MSSPSPVPAPRTIIAMGGPPPHRSPCSVEHVDDVIDDVTNEDDVRGRPKSTAENESSGISSAKSDETPQFSHQVRHQRLILVPGPMRFSIALTLHGALHCLNFHCFN